MEHILVLQWLGLYKLSNWFFVALIRKEYENNTSSKKMRIL